MAVGGDKYLLARGAVLCKCLPRVSMVGSDTVVCTSFTPHAYDQSINHILLRLDQYNQPTCRALESPHKPCLLCIYISSRIHLTRFFFLHSRIWSDVVSARPVESRLCHASHYRELSLQGFLWRPRPSTNHAGEF